MKKIAENSILLLTLIIFCQPVPITNRKQLTLVPQSQMLDLSYQSYKEFVATHQVIENTPSSQMVKKVGRNIQKAVEKFFSEKNQSDLLKDYKWEYTLFKDTSVNAWAMPGGKIGIFTGILPYTRDETGLAVVIGHEIGHTVAQHANERMSQILLVQLGGLALEKALDTQSQMTRQLALVAFGLGSQVGLLLPYSRVQETEADRLGLIFMAMAGYNPVEALRFWQRMSAGKSQNFPEFLSTHPLDETRIKNIKNMLPEALKYYKGDN